jgi:cysteine desulfurase
VTYKAMASAIHNDGRPLPLNADYNATTPIDPEVLQVLVEAHALYGNPSSVHHVPGRMCAFAIAEARERILVALGASGYRVVFTSGATEAINLALLGLTPRSIIIGATEHAAVVEPARLLAQRGSMLRRLPVLPDGTADVDQIGNLIATNPDMFAVMLANNETGVLHPLARIAATTREAGVLLLCDTAQAVGRVPVNLESLGVDFAVISGHKLYGPRGCGALLFAENTVAGRLAPLVRGGGQEYGLRAGTENTPGILALAAAVELAVRRQAVEAAAQRVLRDSFERELTCHVPSANVVAAGAPRLPNTSCFTLSDVEIDAFVASLRPHVAISLGAACSSGSREASRVLLAMNIPADVATHAFRVSFGRMSETNDGRLTAAAVARAWRESRSVRR